MSEVVADISPWQSPQTRTDEPLDELEDTHELLTLLD